MDYYICDCQCLHVSLHSPSSPTLVLFSDHHCWVVPDISQLLFSTPHPLRELSTSLSLDVTCPHEHSEFFFLLSQNWHSQHPHTFLTQESPLFTVRSLSINIPDLFSPFIIFPGLSPHLSLFLYGLEICSSLSLLTKQCEQSKFFPYIVVFV